MFVCVRVAGREGEREARTHAHMHAPTRICMHPRAYACTHAREQVTILLPMSDMHGFHILVAYDMVVLMLVHTLFHLIRSGSAERR